MSTEIRLRHRFSFSSLRVAEAKAAKAVKAFRSLYSPRNSARSRATLLGLQVDTDKARKLDHRQVSVVPLPIIEVCSPLSAPEQPQPPMTPQTVPVNAVEHDLCLEDVERPLSKPVLRCVIPATPEVLLQSRFSSDSEYSVDSIPSGNHSISSSSASSSPCSSASSGTSSIFAYYEQVASASSPSRFFYLTQLSERASVVDLGIKATPVKDSPAAVVVRRQPSLSSGLRIVIAAPKPVYAQLAVPEDIDASRRMSWGCGEMLERVSLESTSSSPTTSSSSSDSSGPRTPEDHRRIVSGSKRKSPIDIDDADDCSEIREIFEKRPKFERKVWIEKAPRRPTRTLSARRS